MAKSKPLPKKAAVIGSGFGGLGAAIRLQSAGIYTVLYEARDLPGGRAYVYQDDGYTFDAGPTVITAPHTLTDLFELTGKKLEDYIELMEVKPMYRLIWSDGDRFDYVRDEATMVKQIAERSQSDADGYQRFFEYAKKVFAKGYTELADRPFGRFSDMVAVSPSLIKLRADRSVYKTVAKYVKDDHLRQALSFHSLLVGGNPFQTSSIYTLIHYLEREWGVYFPAGGTHALVRTLVKLFEELGGEIRLSTPVSSVELIQEGSSIKHRITDGNKGVEEFDLVVSNADVHHTYKKLYSSSKVAKKRAKKLEKMDWSMSLFVLYFGTDIAYDDVAHHTILFGPRYKGLLDEIFKGNSLPEDFSLYLHVPTVTDKSLAPEGCSAAYVLAPVPHLGRADVDWDEIAEEYGDRIIEALEVEMPDLRNHIVTRRHITPKTFESELAAFKGSAFSVAPKLTQSAYFRPSNEDSGIPGLYLVGAGTHPGAGLPGVLNSAKATVDLILSKYD
ncbi:MAG: phytoene desaturase [Candidatus Thermoplasmatota archaeon]|nr:phytoene desaturase [Candidatus Thermoplasmatota archaeon]